MVADRLIRYASIDAVSGASYTSNGYLTSLQSALDRAGLCPDAAHGEQVSYLVLWVRRDCRCSRLARTMSGSRASSESDCSSSWARRRVLAAGRRLVIWS